MSGLTKDKSESPFMLVTVGATTMPSNRIGLLSAEIDLTGLAQSPNALGTHNYQGKVQNNQIRIGKKPINQMIIENNDKTKSNPRQMALAHTFIKGRLKIRRHQHGFTEILMCRREK